MDWVSHYDISLRKDSFLCVNKSRDNQTPTVIQVYDDAIDDYGAQAFRATQKIKLDDQKKWDDWFNDLRALGLFSEEEECIQPSQVHTKGLCILFIPRAAGLEETGTIEPLEPDLTDLPISEYNWDRVSKAFWLLPGHIVKAIRRKLTSTTSILRTAGKKELLYMHIAMTDQRNPHGFAMASTHIDCAKLSLALMIGCSEEQIDRVFQLVDSCEDAILHPLLMLGISAEIHLDRLKRLVAERVTRCEETTRALEQSRRADTEGSHQANVAKQGITWDLINQVRACRDESKRAEEEVKTTERQLKKALPPHILSPVDRGGNVHDSSSSRKNSKDTSVNGANAAPDDESEIDEADEITDMFRERFLDIFAQFEGLMAECRISVGEMSFTADIIRSELARQEARNSAKEAKISTVIAFVAMLYLPMTTIATIFAMPIFQYTNDWRDFRYHKAGKGNSTGPQGPGGSADTGVDLPIFSGYFWIYFAVSTAFTLVTIEGWWRFTSREVERRGRHWSLYLLNKAWISVKARFIRLYLFCRRYCCCCCGFSDEPTQHQQRSQSNGQPKGSGSEPEERKSSTNLSHKNSSSISSRPSPPNGPPIVSVNSAPTSPASKSSTRLSSVFGKIPTSGSSTSKSSNHASTISQTASPTSPTVSPVPLMLSTSAGPSTTLPTSRSTPPKSPSLEEMPREPFTAQSSLAPPLQPSHSTPPPGPHLPVTSSPIPPKPPMMTIPDIQKASWAGSQLDTGSLTSGVSVPKTGDTQGARSVSPGRMV